MKPPTPLATLKMFILFDSCSLTTFLVFPFHLSMVTTSR